MQFQEELILYGIATRDEVSREVTEGSHEEQHGSGT